MALKARRWVLIGVLAVAPLLLAACGSSDDTSDSAPETVVSDDEPVADATTTEDEATDSEPAPPEEAAPEDPEPEVADPDVAQRDPSLPFGVDAAYDADAEPYILWFTAFDPGTYRTGAIGTPLSFTTTEALITQPNGNGTFVITDLSSQAPDDQELFFMRVGSFSDPVAPNTPIDEQAPWPNDDFAGWLDNLDDGVIASDPVETSINGLPAIRVDLELSDDMSCGWEPGFCVGLAENHGEYSKALNRGATYRVWVVEQGDEDPILVIAAIARDDQAEWFERADTVLDTVAFGDIAPNPVQPLAPGMTRIKALGGIEVELPDNLSELTNGRSRFVDRWAGRGFGDIPVTFEPGAVFFADRPHDLDGTPLTTADDVAAELTAGGASLTEIAPATIDGVDARVFDVTTADPGAILLRFSTLDLANPSFGWDAPAAGRIWLIEHPERGLMMISSHAFDDVENLLPVVNELADAIVQTLTFVD